MGNREADSVLDERGARRSIADLRSGERRLWRRAEGLRVKIKRFAATRL